jgi:23S rRNA (uracil1939-C5)-methyltransferase
LILGNRTDFVIGDKYIYETLCDKTFKVSANTFFQVNPKSANNIFIYIRDYISKNFNNPSILDAYAGIAAFGICMSDTASKVVSVEEVKESVDLANEIINDNNINNIKTICMDAGKCFSEMAESDEKFDITILDPPRKGCTKESLEYALKLTTKKIIYVSCNPSSLARDLKFLTEKGCKIKSIQPFDMFPHTYHIENVVIIDR